MWAATSLLAVDASVEASEDVHTGRRCRCVRRAWLRPGAGAAPAPCSVHTTASARLAPAGRHARRAARQLRRCFSGALTLPPIRRKAPRTGARRAAAARVDTFMLTAISYDEWCLSSYYGSLLRCVCRFGKVGEEGMHREKTGFCVRRRRTHRVTASAGNLLAAILCWTASPPRPPQSKGRECREVR